MQRFFERVKISRNHWQELLSIIVFSLVYFLSFLYITKDLTFRMDSDYDMLYAAYTYVVDHIRTHFVLPRVHPYAGMGLPIAGDPGISFYNPFFLLPIVLFGITNGLYIVIVMMMAIGGICMWIALSSLSLSRPIRVLGSILYVVSGAFAARVAAGHLIFILSYPVWPLALWAILKHRSTILGCLTAYFFLSGDIYSIWFLGIFYSATIVFSVATTKNISLIFLIKNVYSFFLYFFLFSSIKIYFVIVDVLPLFERMFSSNPHEGSIHLWSTLLPFIMPLKVMFYDRPFFQKHLGFFFNWYEYYAFFFPLLFVFFISPIKALILSLTQDKTKIVHIKNDDIYWSIRLLCVFFITGLLYICVKYPYSPFYWIFEMIPQLSIFRVPQRMYIPLSSIVLLLACLSANQWKNSSATKIIFIITTGGTMIASLHAMSLGFERPRTEEYRLVSWLKNYDNGNYFVYTDLCCIQRFLVEQKISIMNFYAGWKPKNSPSFSHKNRPTYIIARPTEDFSDFSYRKLYQSPIGIIWKTDQPTIVPDDKRKLLEKSKKESVQKYLL